MIITDLRDKLNRKHRGYKKPPKPPGPSKPVNTSLPSITGVTTGGETLTGHVGTWVGAVTYAYQWLRNGVAISGATGVTYAPQVPDTGARLTFQVRAINAVGSTIALSVPSSVIADPPPVLVAPVNVTLPGIVGTAREDQTLTATTGTWTGNPNPTFSYQWKAGGVVVGANSPVYTVQASDVGQTITVMVTALNSKGQASATSLPTAAVQHKQGPAGVFKLGVNASGMEYATQFYPVISNDEIDFYASKGMEHVRLPLRGETMVPAQGDPLNQTYLGQVKSIASYCATKGLRLIPDFHDFGRRYGAAINTSGFTIAEFARVWGLLATEFASFSNVAFDLMNEWHDQPIADIINAQKAAIAAIRAAGFAGEIYVEGNAYSGAWNWVNNNPGFEAVPLSDPLNKTIISAHCYPDNNSSGGVAPNGGYDYDAEVAKGETFVGTNGGSNPTDTSGFPTGPQVYVNRIKVFADWLALYGLRGHIGEFGAYQQSTFGATVPEPRWITAVVNGLAYCQSRNIEVSLWAAGPAWGEYPMSLESYRGRQAFLWPYLTDITGKATQPTAYFIDCPPRGTSGVATTVLFSYRGDVAGLTITPAMDGSGSWSAASVTLSGRNPSATLTFTPSATRTYTLTATNNKGFTNPAPFGFSTQADPFATIEAAGNTFTPILNPFFRLYTPYIGPLAQFKRIDGAMLDVYGDSTTNAIDRQALADWAGTNTPILNRVYDQSGAGNDETFSIAPLANLNNAQSRPEVTWPAGKFGELNVPTSGYGGQMGWFGRYKWNTGAFMLSQDVFTGPWRIQGGDWLVGGNAIEPNHVTASFGSVAGAWHTFAGTWTPNSAAASVTPAPTNSTLPTISGTPQEGQTLVVSNGTWTGSPTSFSYQWKRGATNVGTNSNTYVPSSSDIGSRMSCVVTATNAGGSTSATTVDTAIVTSGAPGTPPPSDPGTVTAPTSFNIDGLQVSVGDVTVPGGATSVNVPISLNVPTNQTIGLDWETQNGTALAGADYAASSGTIWMNPGEQTVVVNIPLLGTLGSKAFTVYAGRPKNYPQQTFPKATGTVTGAAGFPAPAVAGTRLVLPTLHTMPMVFEETFNQATFKVSDSGFMPDGSRAWMSRLGFGYAQYNGEVAYYCNPTQTPGIQPWGWEGGVFYIEGRTAPSGIVTKDGTLAKMPDGSTAKFIASTITTGDGTGNGLFLIRNGDAVETRFKMTPTVNSWPASWGVVAQHWLWPLIEQDQMEGFFNPGNVGAEWVASTNHYKNGAGDHAQFGLNGLMQAVPNYNPFVMNTYRMEWRADRYVYFLNGIPYAQFPNTHPDVPVQWIYDMTCGGSVGTPTDPAWNPKLYIEYLRVFRS